VFKGYSTPVLGGASDLAVGWPRQTQLALVMNNNARNLQIPEDSVHMTLTWGGKQPADMPWEPNSTSVTTLQVSERWSRDLVYSPGQQVHARLLYRRSMLEMYIPTLTNSDFLTQALLSFDSFLKCACNPPLSDTMIGAGTSTTNCILCMQCQTQQGGLM
jgi:hypothetical protein